MPTGYTACIEKGASFKDYAWTCARAFGALASMREDSFGAPIPEKLEASPYYLQKKKQSEQDLSKLKSMSLKDAEIKAKAEYNEALKYRTKELKERNELEKKYRKILNQVQSWKVPSPDHDNFKEFMVSQIISSIQGDCGTDYLDIPKLLTGKEWKELALKNIKHDLDYYGKEYEDEIISVEEKNLWLKQLRESLPN